MYKQTNEWQISRKTRTGAIVLMSLILIMIVVWRLLPAWKTPGKDPDSAQLQAAWSDFKKKNIVEDSGNSRQSKPSYNGSYRRDSDQEEARPQQFHLAPFDPNTASEEELVAIGFPPRTAKTMIKYRSKGGKFRKKRRPSKTLYFKCRSL